jgi:hypothetical protein
MTKSERRKKAILAQKKRELHKIKSSPNTATRRGNVLLSRAILAKHKKGGKKYKTKKSKK